MQHQKCIGNDMYVMYITTSVVYTYNLDPGVVLQGFADRAALADQL